MLQPKQVIVSCRLGSGAESPIEFTIDLRQKRGHERIVDLLLTLQLFEDADLPAPPSHFYKSTFTRFVDELAKLAGATEGKVELWDFDSTNYLYFIKVASEPDTIMMGGALRYAGVQPKYLVANDEPEVRKFLSSWLAGVAFHAILLTNEETERLVQDLKGFLASDE